MSKLTKNEDAFTGLEAAIVLIAFVVVAAVFSYVVLGAGFFTTQKSQEVVHTGVSQASSNVEVSGPVVVQGSGTMVGNIQFNLQLAAGGSPVDMNKVTYTVSTGDKVILYGSDNVGKVWKNRDSKNNELLEMNEFVLVTIGEEVALPNIGTNVRFTVEVKPDVGASYPIQRNAPKFITDGEYYEVY